MRRANRLLLLVTAALVLAGCGDNPRSEETVTEPRPETWADPAGDHSGLSNFYKVSDELYRGARPDDEGFAELAKLGIKTVVNLQTFHSDGDECEEAGLNCIQIRVQAWEGEDEEVIEFLQIASDPDNHPVFVHCHHGSDRTGVMSAAYRIIIQGWSKEEAILEMTEGGYGFHSIWQNLVDYVQELDVDRIRRLSEPEIGS